MPSEPKKIFRTRCLAVITVLFWVGFYIVADMIKPGYSSVSQFISELNATGSAWDWQIGYFGFVPLGLLFASFLLAANSLVAVQGISRAGWWLMWSQPLAFIGVAIAPCDLGCPMDGSFMQTLHSLIALVTYFAGALGLFLLSFASRLDQFPFARFFFRAASIVFVLVFVVMLMPQVAAVRGLLQRSADVLLALSVLLMAWFLLVDRPANIQEQ